MNPSPLLLGSTFTKRSRLLLVLLLLFAFVAASYLRAKERKAISGAHRLWSDTATFDFGRVTWADRPSHVFHLVNVDRRELLIDRMEESCSCTATGLSSHHLAPGGRGVLTVQFHPLGFTGRVERTISLWLRGSTQPVTLTVRADVNPLLRPVPNRVELGLIQPGERAKARIILENTSGHTVRINAVRTSADYVRANLVSMVLAPNANPALDVSLINPAAGRLCEAITLRTSLRARPEIEIPVRAQVACKWILSDPEFFFGFVNRGEQPTRIVVIRGLHPEQIRRVRSDVPGSSVHLLPDRTGPGTEVALSLNLADAREGPLAGGVLIETKDPQQRRLRIPCVAAIQTASESGDCCAGRRKEKQKS